MSVKRGEIIGWNTKCMFFGDLWSHLEILIICWIQIVWMLMYGDFDLVLNWIILDLHYFNLCSPVTILNWCDHSFLSVVSAKCSCLRQSCSLCTSGFDPLGHLSAISITDTAVNSYISRCHLSFLPLLGLRVLVETLQIIPYVVVCF